MKVLTAKQKILISILFLTVDDEGNKTGTRGLLPGERFELVSPSPDLGTVTVDPANPLNFIFDSGRPNEDGSVRTGFLSGSLYDADGTLLATGSSEEIGILPEGNATNIGGIVISLIDIAPDAPPVDPVPVEEPAPPVDIAPEDLPADLL